MAAMLLSPLAPWLVLAAGGAVGLAIANRRLALPAAIALVALLLGAGRGALATSP